VEEVLALAERILDRVDEVDAQAPAEEAWKGVGPAASRHTDSLPLKGV
jgi:hypothetical protein